MRSSVLLGSIALVALAGSPACRPPEGDGDGDVDADGDVDTDGDADSDSDADAHWSYDGGGQGCTKVDLLFVVDNSGSMAEEQSNLAANFPQFIRLLEEYRTPADSQLDYRVGVTSTARDGLSYVTRLTQKAGGPECVTTDTCPRENQVCECPGNGFEVCDDSCPAACFCEPPGTTMPMPGGCSGEDGRLVVPPGYTEPWIQGPGDHVATAFSSTANLGTSGCGFEMPLYAMEHALSPEFQSAPGAPNAGFLRPDALLMVIILTDEDDCSSELDRVEQDMIIDINHLFASMTGDMGCTDADGFAVDEQYVTMEHYVEFLDGLMGQRNHWTAAVIAGESSCSSDYGDAYTAYRLLRFVDLAGENALFADICQADLSSALRAALERLQIACDEYVLI